VTDSVILRDNYPSMRALRGEIALAEGRFDVALRETYAADSLSDGKPHFCPPCIEARLGRAFDLAGMPDSAIVMWERYVTTPNTFSWSVDADFLAGAHKRLGELYEARGEPEKALSHYLQFVELWKDADPELQPKVREVRARITRLQDTEKRGGRSS
jgi:eukaryotic-like serine/threonine-protein kinase